MKSPCFFTLKINKLGFIGELAKPSPVGEGGPRSGFPETSIAQFWGFAMVVDEEFLNVCNYSSVCSPTLDLRCLSSLLADTFSRKRRLLFVCYRFFSYLAFVVGRRSLASHVDPYGV